MPLSTCTELMDVYCACALDESRKTAQTAITPAATDCHVCFITKAPFVVVVIQSPFDNALLSNGAANQESVVVPST